MHADFDWNVVASSWIKRFSLCCSFVSIVHLIRVFLWRRRLREHKLKQRGQKEAPSLLMHVELAFIWCICSQILFIGETVPGLCYWAVFLRPIASWYPHITRSLYQLARLKASFNTHKHTDDITQGLAYPNCIYTLLYLLGAAQAIVILIIPLSLQLSPSVTIEILELPHNAGCSYSAHHAIPSSVYVSVMLMFLVWDCCILGMYARRLYQLQTRLLVGERPKPCKAIRDFLKKIVFLSVLTDATVLVVFGWSRIVWLPSLLWSEAIAIPIDIWTVFIVLFLMLDENEDDYLDVLQWMKRGGFLTACCCCFGDLESEYATLMLKEEDEASLQRTSYDDDDIVNTNTTNTEVQQETQQDIELQIA